MDERTAKIKKIQKLAKVATNPDLLMLDQTDEIIDKIDEAVKKIETLPKEIPAFPEIPQPKEVVFPEVQKVEIVNFPEQKEIPAPVVNVEAPIVNVEKPDAPVVNVEAPIVNVDVDTTKIEKVLEKNKPQDLPLENDRIAVSLDREDVKTLIDGFNKQVKVQVSGGGGGVQTTAAIENTLSNYKISAGPLTDTGYLYIGYMDKDGNWYIKRQETTTKIWGYVKGSSDFDTAWANKTSQTYANFNLVF